MNDEVLVSSRSESVATQSGDQGLTINREDGYISPLLRLPAELRIMIYEYAFANEIVHVQPKSTDPIADLYTPRTPGAQKYQSVISLLMTCRTIRKEASSIFNGLVTFDLTHYYNCMAAATQQNTISAPLLRLPRKIRNKMYDYVLVGETVRVHYSHLKDDMQEQMQEQVQEQVQAREKDWYEFLDVFGLFTPPLGLLACWLEYIAEHNRKRKGVLALLFTCRQTHNEFIALFYSGVVFDLTAFEFRTGWPCIRQSCYQSVQSVRSSLD
ncbi:predicted protein [Pyrenophora tritici-repentis Pt-1C-BFP]|uniref:Uncharacterized protein n=2 Tax=Pyrenophora tritici-repentis TaxID=45151 RepID=A0A922SVC1_9PLEO|nr:uncharacterized protein PTRG_04299 [Pyrenophora tritici-repentis Pt-1C-BFP]EDU47137.1 predicted protein [Pyrenophora tritici-repentis Pt-1C-BFP]KAI1510625.1 hypothetical protein Ptr86124_010430 [Pyrenophora tritici-repentis]KAI1681435.1 hypothetical protein KJE20_08306 [Pyrenophora tritici-repentis]